MDEWLAWDVENVMFINFHIYMHLRMMEEIKLIQKLIYPCKLVIYGLF